MAEPVQITDTNFDAEVLQNDRVVLANFWAEWRDASKKQLDTLQKIAADLGDDVKIAAVNIDEAPATVSAYRVLNVPTIIAFKNRLPVVTMEGEITASSIKKQIKPYLPPE